MPAAAQRRRAGARSGYMLACSAPLAKPPCQMWPCKCGEHRSGGDRLGMPESWSAVICCWDCGPCKPTAFPEPPVARGQTGFEGEQRHRKPLLFHRRRQIHPGLHDNVRQLEWYASLKRCTCRDLSAVLLRSAAMSASAMVTHAAMVAALSPPAAGTGVLLGSAAACTRDQGRGGRRKSALLGLVRLGCTCCRPCGSHDCRSSSACTCAQVC